MKHPTREEWMAFLYEDSPTVDRHSLDEHLKECSACERQVAAWRGTLAALDNWHLPERKPATTFHWARWAAAAAIFVGIGILIGNFATARKLRNEFATESTLTRSLIGELAQAVAERRSQDQEALLATLRELETRRAGEMKLLRQDLETVAANTQVQLGRLVSYSGR